MVWCIFLDDHGLLCGRWTGAEVERSWQAIAVVLMKGIRWNRVMAVEMERSRGNWDVCVELKRTF